jgi:GTP-binding protein
VFDLFVSLEASDAQMNYPTLYCSAREGWAVRKVGDSKTDMTPIFETLRDYVPPPTVDRESPFRMLVTMLEYDEYDECCIRCLEWFGVMVVSCVPIVISEKW